MDPTNGQGFEHPLQLCTVGPHGLPCSLPSDKFCYISPYSLDGIPNFRTRGYPDGVMKRVMSEGLSFVLKSQQLIKTGKN